MKSEHEKEPKVHRHTISTHSHNVSHLHNHAPSEQRLSCNFQHSISLATVTWLAPVVPIQESLQPGMVQTLAPLGSSVSYYRELIDRDNSLHLQQTQKEVQADGQTL